MTPFQVFFMDLFLDSIWQFSRIYREAVELNVHYAVAVSKRLYPDLWGESKRNWNHAT